MAAAWAPRSTAQTSTLVTCPDPGSLCRLRHSPDCGRTHPSTVPLRPGAHSQPGFRPLESHGRLFPRETTASHVVGGGLGHTPLPVLLEGSVGLGSGPLPLPPANGDRTLLCVAQAPTGPHPSHLAAPLETSPDSVISLVLRWTDGRGCSVQGAPPAPPTWDIRNRIRTASRSPARLLCGQPRNRPQGTLCTSTELRVLTGHFEFGDRAKSRL